MEKLTVIGTGTMGHSIALSIAWANFPVTIYGLNKADISNGRKGIAEKLDTFLENHVLDEKNVEKINSNIFFSDNLEESLKDATFVIEAVPEEIELKQQLFQKLDILCAHNVVLASNSSSLKPTKIAEKVKHPERVIGTHFWNPAHLIPLVEIIRGEKTEQSYIDRAQQLLLKIRKKPILVNKEVVGFVGNRLQFALFREAQYLFESGVASMEDIDTAVELSIGRRLGITGPFKTADMGGLDIFQAISNYLFPHMSNQEKSFSSIDQLVNNDQLGLKSGSGYYEWDEDFRKTMLQQRERELLRWLKQDLL